MEEKYTTLPENKLPPLEKIYEAWSAIADGRVDIPGDATPAVGKAFVTSSDRTKTYTVTWDDDSHLWRSNDNATFWRGYPGYPILAVMMMQGKLPLDRPLLPDFRDINWNELNRRHRRDYAAALDEVIVSRGLNDVAIHEQALKAYDALKHLRIAVKREPAPVQKR